jgi:hypothetical protein
MALEEEPMSTALAKRASGRAEEARDRREKVRQELARSMSGRSLIELSLEASAADAEGQGLFLSALQRLEEELGVSAVEMREDATGAYGLFVTELPALLARRRASRLEGQESWDRRLSIECYGLGSLGTTGRVPRTVVGAAPRAR